MPTIDYKCLQCDHCFSRVILKGDDSVRTTCPECKSNDVKPSVQPTRLFEGIANFSTLAKDTN